MSAPGARKEEGGSLLQSLQALLAEIPGLISDRVHLLALELRRARQALVQILGLLVLAGVLAATAWLALWVGLVAAAIAAGIHGFIIWIVVLGFNVLGVYFALKRIRVLARLLTLPATLRHMTVSPPAPDLSMTPKETSDGYPVHP